MVSVIVSTEDESLYAYLLSALAKKGSAGPGGASIPFQYGILEVKSMVVQDMLPVEIRV
jgi:hypothetical protein